MLLILQILLSLCALLLFYLSMQWVFKTKNIAKEHQIEYIDYVNHTEVPNYQYVSQLLLLSINHIPNAKGIVTGKIFEYLQAERPILAIGPEDGDAAFILNESHGGKMFDFDNEEALESFILEQFKKYQEDTLSVNSSNIEKYHRKELTRQLAELIRSI